MSRTAVIPAANAGGFAFILAVMWYVGMGQGNGAAYLLFFTLLGVLAVSVPKTWLNLGGLKVAVESANPAFAGEEIAFAVEILNGSRRARRAVAVTLPGAGRDDATGLVDEIRGGKSARTVLRFSVECRGEYRIEKIRLSSAWPLGFFKAKRTAIVQQHYLVYPRPAGNPEFPGSTKGRAQEAGKIQPEGDDFAGVRPYLPGESQRHIDWKAAARGHALMSKQFAMDEGGELHFDFDGIATPDVEARLSQLALWVVEAGRAGRSYSLRLPLVEIAASTGDAHYHKCLRALASYR